MLAIFNKKLAVSNMNVVAEMYIKNKEDMECVERVIVRQLGGEGSRCVFLRSCPYLKLRMSVLYRNDCRQHSVFHEGICVSATCVVGQPPLVRVLQLDRIADTDESGKKRQWDCA